MRGRWLGMVVVGWLSGMALAWAGEPEVVIYCATDRVVYGYVKAGQSLEQELKNIQTSAGYQADCNAELKTATLPTGRPPYHRGVVNADGTATTELYPEYVAYQAAQASKKAKLEALGFTEAEIATLK